ncbi:cupin domain-containing protein [Streptomyces sp. NPDC041068]|uniref:cupin domain-containing protein n=1 Tax=Streptomyces sp. NPDC041068 TaxID=3155130 RepID=UPI0033C5BFFF
MPSTPDDRAGAFGGEAPVFVGPERTVADGPGRIRVVWSLGGGARDLDAVVVRLAPGAVVDERTEAAFGVLFTVLSGGGELRVRDAEFTLAPGALAWVPAGAGHSVRAGGEGLTYTTAHRRSARQLAGAEVLDGAGEPVCLLDRVCPECGRLAAERDARYCARCGSSLTATD